MRAVTDTGLPVTISKDGISPVDARSLLEVMTADFGCGCDIELAVAEESIPDRYTMEDAEVALDALCALLGRQRSITAQPRAAEVPLTPQPSILLT